MDGQQDLGLYLYLNGSRTGFHYARLGRSNDWTISSLNLEDFPSIGNSEVGIAQLAHDSLLENETLNRLVFRTPDQNSRFQIDYVQVSSSPIDDAFLSNYLSRMTSGGSVTVIDSSGFGSFAKMMNLTITSALHPVTILSSRSDSIQIPMINVQSVSSSLRNIVGDMNFSSQVGSIPLISSLKVGAGKLTFVYAEPLILGIESAKDSEMRQELFRGLQFVGSSLTESNSLSWQDSPGPPQGFVELPGAMISSLIDLSGSIAVTTGFVELDTTSRFTVAFNFTSGALEEGTYLVRSLRTDGSGTFSISSTSVTLGLLSRGPYAGVAFPAGFQLMFRSSGAPIQLGLETDKGAINATIPENQGLLMSTSNSSELLAYSPSIAASGISVFRNAWYDKIGPKSDPARGTDLRLNSAVTFRFDEGDFQSMRVIGLNFGGPSSQVTYFNAFSNLKSYSAIPWLSVIFSTSNYILLMVVFVILIFAFLLKVHEDTKNTTGQRSIR